MLAHAAAVVHKLSMHPHHSCPAHLHLPPRVHPFITQPLQPYLADALASVPPPGGAVDAHARRGERAAAEDVGEYLVARRRVWRGRAAKDGRCWRRSRSWGSG
jgi:hypothetical protein